MSVNINIEVIKPWMIMMHLEIINLTLINAAFVFRKSTELNRPIYECDSIIIRQWNFICEFHRGKLQRLIYKMQEDGTLLYLFSVKKNHQRHKFVISENAPCF